MAMTDKELREIINEGFKSQREWLEATLNPIQKDIDKHTEMAEKVPILEQKLDHHLTAHSENDNKKRFNIELLVMVGVFIIDKIFQYFPPAP